VESVARAFKRSAILVIFLIVPAAGGRISNVRERRHRKSEDYCPEPEDHYRQSESHQSQPGEHSEESGHAQYHRQEPETDSRQTKEITFRLDYLGGDAALVKEIGWAAMIPLPSFTVMN
jgi:hypothetical protein